MLTDLLNAILDLRRPAVLEFDGKRYATEKLTPIDDPRPEPLAFHTLTGLATYINDHASDLPALEKLIITVTGPTTVDLVSEGLGPFAKRRICATAKIDHQEFRFGHYIPQEEFVVALLSLFEESADREAVLATVGNLSCDTAVNVQDDGVSQQVTVNSSLVRKANVVVKNPVKLFPYRTFLEVNQPACTLILRIRKGGDGVSPMCALFEADGGRWRNAACKEVAAWLRSNTKVTVLA